MNRSPYLAPLFGHVSEYLPARTSMADRLADAWRIAHSRVDHHLIFVAQYARVASPLLARELAAYRAAVRATSEAETAMEAAGIVFDRQEV